MKELEKGRTIETPYGHVVHLDLRHLGAKKINAKIPFVRELCMKYQNLDPVKDLIPVRPVVHYMMGGVHTDINGATPLPGLYAAGETACVSINGANRLGSNSLTECLVFGARAGKAAAEYASLGLELNPRRDCAEDRRTSPARARSAEQEGARTYRHPPRRDAEVDGTRAPASTATARSLGQGMDEIRRLQERYADVAIEDHSRTFNTERIAALELECMLDVAESIVTAAHAPRGVARRAPAHRFPEARRRALPGALADLSQRRRLGARRLPPGHDYPLAAGRAGLWREGTAWRTESRCRSRGIVRSRSLRPPSTSSTCPCPKDWVILDGLNHVKDQLDGTLAYRWSCRMGICGSCGMTVNGEPKLTCATFLHDYAPGPIRVEPLRNFPVIRDLIVDIGDFMRKLVTVKPWIVRDEERPLSDGEYPPDAR